MHKKALSLGGVVCAAVFVIGMGGASLAFASSSIVNLLPTGEGYSLQWTPSAGTTHYTLVDESSCNGTTDYVQTTTVGQRDAYSVNISSIPTGSIITAVAIKPCASRVNGGGTNPLMNVFYRFDGTNSSDAGSYALTGTTPVDLGTTTFSGLSKVVGATSTLQIGAVLTSGAKGARLSRIVTQVTYVPLAAPSLTVYTSTSTPNDAQLSFSSSGATSYTLERSFNSTSSFAFLSTTSNTFYTDVAPGSGTWWYRATASNSNGTSDYSPSRSVTLP